MADPVKEVLEKAIVMIQELKRNPDMLPRYRDDTMRECTQQINNLYNQNSFDIQNLRSGLRSDREQCEQMMLYRQAEIANIKRYCLAYIRERSVRIKALRWKHGGVLPAQIKNNLCEAEIEFFNEYCFTLADFQSKLGENGVNLMLHTDVPKTLFVQVRVIEDYGDFETSDGNVVMLSSNSIHSLPRRDCEMLIRQGILSIVN